MQNLVYEWSIFQNVSKLEKIGKNQVILLKIWSKIEQVAIGIWMGHFFLKIWYLYGSLFKFCGSTSIPKPNLSTPPVSILVLSKWVGSFSTWFFIALEGKMKQHRHLVNLTNILCTHFDKKNRGYHFPG